jgi:hypothetical protein
MAYFCACIPGITCPLSLYTTVHTAAFQAMTNLFICREIGSPDQVAIGLPILFANQPALDNKLLMGEDSK